MVKEKDVEEDEIIAIDIEPVERKDVEDDEEIPISHQLERKKRKQPSTEQDRTLCREASRLANRQFEEDKLLTLSDWKLLKLCCDAYIANYDRL